MRFTQQSRRELFTGLAFTSPWIVGLVFLALFPLAYNGYLSFHEYSGMGEPLWIGWENYSELFFEDDDYWLSLYNTIYYTLLAVPAGVIVAILLALAMNQKLGEISVYRTILAMPSVLPLFALTIVFVTMWNPKFGLFNMVLGLFNIHIDWMGDPAFVKISLVLLSQLGAGQFALIFLASMRGISTDLYDAASIDGANAFQKFFKITLPMITPVILFDIIIGLGFGLQYFIPAIIVYTDSAESPFPNGPADSALFNPLYIYRQAFQYGEFGIAAAISTLLFLLNIIVAILIFKSSKHWVYDGE